MSNYTKFFAEIPIAAKDVDFVLPIIEQMLNGDRESAFDFPEHDLFKHERLYSVLYNATSEWFDEVPDPMDRLRGARTTIKRNEDGGVVITVRAAINYECGIINHFRRRVRVLQVGGLLLRKFPDLRGPADFCALDGRLWLERPSAVLARVLHGQLHCHRGQMKPLWGRP
jgi:hypothetical protein